MKMVTRTFAKTRRTIYTGAGTPKTVSCSYVKNGKLILGSGKRRKLKKRTVRKQKGGAWGTLAAVACVAVQSRFCKENFLRKKCLAE